MMLRFYVLIGLLALATAQQAVFAEDPSVRIIGRDEITVTTNAVSMADVAEVYSDKSADDDIVIALKKIILDQSPVPGKSKLLSAAQILAKLRANQVDLKQVGYSLPRSIKVIRASRELSYEEIEQALSQYLANENRDVAISKLLLDKKVQVAPGDIALVVKPFEIRSPGKMGFRVRALVADAPDVNFNLQAEINEWREIPVAGRSLARGSIVGAEDLLLERKNMASLGPDVELEEMAVVGMELKQNIGYGEVFSKNKLVIPPLIRSGAKVTMVYRSKYFEATASGIALEEGLPGQPIRVKNPNSNKVILGRALEAGLVEVTQ
ncbi:MAG: flagellar basal body P-ring formation protein FlgA [Bdellovibrionales bacterium]|nr:flagellar basal body P-ring formation protein FlgA [Bdellovibrionales bacterium]